MANHHSILAVRTSWIVQKAKKIRPKDESPSSKSVQDAEPLSICKMSSFPRPHHWYFKAGKFFASFAQTESLKETGTIDFSMDLHVWDEGGANSFHGIRWGNLIEPVLKVDSFPPPRLAGEFGADYQFLSRGASPWGGLGFLTPWLQFPRTSILEGSAWWKLYLLLWSSLGRQQGHFSCIL